MMATASADAPVTDIDPFDPAFLDQPYADHAALREAGPVVWMARYDLWAVARYEPVQAALTNHEIFCSRFGVGLADFRKEAPWRPPSLILEADPPDHTRTRRILARILSPLAVRQLRARFEAEAETLVTGLVAQGRFDAVAELAEPYPVKVFPDAVGLPEDGRRENLLAYGAMTFNGFGPRNALFHQAMANADAVRGWIMARCSRAMLAPDGMGAQIYAAADAGELTETEAGMLVRSFLSAGVDTTVNAIGNAIWCLARHPDQWALLRDDPSLARAAFEEALRYEAAVQIFFRTAAADTSLAGVAIAEGTKLLMFLGAANRDPRRWPDADRFDIRRETTGHVGFGAGIHGCVGQMVARLEGELILRALARRVHTLALDGEPVRALNNSLRGFARLPVVVTAR